MSVSPYGSTPPAASLNGGYSAATGYAASAASNGMNPCQQAVHQVLVDPSYGENGVHVDELCKRLQGQFSRQQINIALEFLQNEAHCYSTCDDCHWKGT